MATITIGGSSRCSVTRPLSETRPSGSVRAAGKPSVSRRDKPARTKRTVVPAASASTTTTLRRAVIHHFNAELTRYGGQADVVFDRTSQQVLDLSGPAHQFRIRRRSSPPLGLIQVEVHVLAEGGIIQTVPLVVRVTMSRRVAVARRSINQGATLRASDVEIISVTFDRVDRLGIGDVAHAIGQRAKRFISAGSLIKPDELESVPLVTRGQLVTLVSLAGNVRVVTTAKAAQNGLLGETITVRSLDRKRVEFDAEVVGPGAVQIGVGPTLRSIATLARGDHS